jgi:hypothetical protein
MVEVQVGAGLEDHVTCVKARDITSDVVLDTQCSSHFIAANDRN